MQRFRAFVRTAFPEQREVIVRTNGRVRYVRIGRAGQFAAATLLGLAVAWAAYATHRYSSHAEIVAARDARIAALKKTNDAVRADLSLLRGSIAAKEDALAASESESATLHADNEALRGDIARLTSEIDQRTRARENLSQSHQQAVEEGLRLTEEVRRLDQRREELKQRLARAEKTVASVDAERERLRGVVAGMRERVAAYQAEVDALSDERSTLAAELQSARDRLAAAVEQKDRILSERQTLDGQVADLSSRLESLEVAHHDVVERLGERARQSASPLRRALQIAGLDVDRLLERLSVGVTAEDGIGGPFVALSEEPGSGLAQQIAAVENRIDTLQGMQALMEHLPLTPPLDEFRITSGFGRRADPFTNTLALHPGLDLASRDLAPVMVTAPGVVTFVGWKGGFGKMVEVDHGLGLRTRYAHMAKLFVKRGQTLEFREKVGLVGSTGRSTAPHLHYEILVDGRPQDPANFMKAGQYVFKN